jgi:biopolymer transport protein ExbD
MSQSILKRQTMRGPLASNSKGGKAKKPNMVFSLNLTALIDAFSILVIFLLSNYSGDAQNVNLSNKITLPNATQSQILNMGTVVKIEDNRFFIDDKEVRFENLLAKLIEAKTSKKSETEDVQNSLIIQADRQLDFNVLSPVIRAGGSAGFNQYKFAVMPQSGSTRKQ